MQEKEAGSNWWFLKAYLDRPMKTLQFLTPGRIKKRLT